MSSAKVDTRWLAGMYDYRELVRTYAQWRRLRRWALDRAGDACEVCGHHAEGGKNLVCHEQWTYDEPAATQTLAGVEIHCRDCDSVTQIGLTGVMGGPLARMKALRRLAEVNGWTPQQVMEHFRTAQQAFARRRDLAWS